MKKRIALLLAAVSLLSLAACGKKEEPAETTQETLPVLTEASVITEATETETPTTENTVPTEPEETVPESIPVESQPTYILDDKFEYIEETVYAKRNVNVREDFSVQSKKVGELKKDDAVLRIGKSKDGWSAVIFQDQLCYIATEYLTTKAPSNGSGSGQVHKDVTETPAGGIVYTNHYVNLRQGPGADTAFIVQIPHGAKLERLATCDNGWVKVSYKGNIGYVSGGYLSGAEPVPETTVPETTAPVEKDPTDAAEETTEATEATDPAATTNPTTPTTAETTAPTEGTAETSKPATAPSTPPTSQPTEGKQENNKK